MTNPNVRVLAVLIAGFGARPLPAGAESAPLPALEASTREFSGVLRREAQRQAAYALRWEGKRWACLDMQGKAGLNAVSAVEVARTKEGQCADLRGAALDRAPLAAAYFRGAALRGASLRGANLEGAILAWADVSEARIEGAILAGVKANGASFRNARLNGAVLRLANLMDADFRGADLSGAALDGAMLGHAAFDDATKLPFSRDEALRLGMIFISTP